MTHLCALIQEEVARFFMVDFHEMLSERRARHVARPRQIAMYFCQELTRHSLPKIGAAFHRDHTTIMHGTRLIRRLLREDADFAADMMTLRARLVEKTQAWHGVPEMIDETMTGLRSRLLLAAKANPTKVLAALSEIEK